MRNTIFLLLLIITSCTPPIVFEDAYPINRQNLDRLPDVYQDVFMCESDSTLVIINDHDIILREEHYFKSRIDKLEEREDCSIIGNEMYINHTQECVPLEFVNDSIVKGLIVNWDTLFIMGPKSIAREYKGHIVISQLMETDQWSISLLSLDEDLNITYRGINDKTQINEIKKITTTKPINTGTKKRPQYAINPSMKEFDQLIANQKIFIDCEYLIRINLETSDLYIH